MAAVAESLRTRIKGWGRRLPALAAVAFAIGLASPAWATVAPPLPPDAVIDGNPVEWAGQPPAFTLIPQAAGARSGRIWVGQDENGLVIAGTVDGPPPRFADGPGDMAGFDHVQVWVALTDDIPLPKIGWGNQFGPTELDGPDGCDAIELAGEADDPIAFCRDWFRAQIEYRQSFRKLFVRQWQLAPDSAVEVFARPAFDALAAEVRELIAPLEPKGRPRALFKPNPEGGYGFEATLPWNALPPSPKLVLESVRLLIDVYSPGAGGRYGALSSSAGARRLGDVRTMNQVQLEPVRRWRLSACAYPLQGKDTWGERTLPGFVLPAAAPVLDEMFVIENLAAGYQYLPEAVSPVITPTRHFALNLKPDLTLCGPPVAVRRGDAVARDDKLTIRPGIRAAPVAGGWLVADGPWTGIATRFGTGACGACPLISLQVLFLPADAGPPRLAFAETWLVEDEAVEPESESEEANTYARNARIAISEDLRTVTVWDGEPSEDRSRITWTKSRFCYDDRSRLISACGRPVKERPPLEMPMPPDEPS